MNISYFREFIILAKVGNFTEASEELYISQSSLSKHIKNMETELGVPLFNRTAKKLELTEMGRILLEDAGKISELQSHYLEQLSCYRQKKHLATLCVGMISMMPYYHLTALLSDFSSEQPAIHLDLMNNEDKELADALLSKKCEIAIMRPAFLSDPRISRIPLLTDFFCVVLSKSHRLAGQSSLSLAELDSEQFLLFSPSLAANSPEQFEAIFLSDLGFPPKCSTYLTTYVYILDLVQRNMGVTIMSHYAAEYYIALYDDIVAIPLSPMRSFELSLCTLTDYPLSAAATAFVSYVTKHKDSLLIKTEDPGDCEP